LSSGGLILFAHGARDPRWAEPFEAIAQRVRAQRPGLLLQLAYLEFMSPDLPGAAAQLCAAGCSTIEILPLFLGTGGHLRKDLPPMVQQLQQQYPSVRWTLHAAVGEQPSVMQAIADTAAALAPGDEAPKDGAR
jgi:sirohydrochlorin cobaltochelatase